MEDDTNTFRVQLRQRHDEVVSGEHVRLVRLVKVERGGFGSEERRDDEVDFTVGETATDAVSAMVLCRRRPLADS